MHARMLMDGVCSLPCSLRRSRQAVCSEATAPKSTIDVYTYAVPCVHTAPVSAETEREY